MADKNEIIAKNAKKFIFQVFISNITDPEITIPEIEECMLNEPHRMGLLQFTSKTGKEYEVSPWYPFEDLTYGEIHDLIDLHVESLRQVINETITEIGAET